MQPTKYAQQLRVALEKLGLRVLTQVKERDVDGRVVKTIDLAIPAARLNIEVDGRQHLTDPYQLLSDLKRAHYSDRKGYDTVHVSNHAIYEDLGEIASALSEAAAIREEQFKTREDARG